MRPIFSLFSALALTICLSPFTHAQVSDPVVTASAPVLGAGHHYLGTGTESVNPADGLLTFDLPIQTPPGRQLSFPFGFRYSSAEQYSVRNPTGPPEWFLNPSTPYEINGWSYQLPVLTATYAAYSYGTSYTGPPPQGEQQHQCDVSLDYVFRALDGKQYTLYLGGQWIDANLSTNTSCNSAYSTVGGAIDLLASIPTFPSSGVPDGAPVVIVDASGTTYNAPDNTPAALGYGAQASAWGALATLITDKNGNQITLNTNQKGYTDTLGRPVVSWTGIGNSGDQVSVSGLPSNITLKWESTPVTFPEKSTYLSGSSHCSISGTSSNINVVSEIDLPNGQKYTFTYEQIYGRVSKITFPDGGYVRYLWGLNTNSASGYFQGYNPSSGFFNCTLQYDQPAVTDRYVSYDGSTEVLHQHFTYPPTNWDTATPYVWDSKSTTVTATDMITNQVTVTNYTYSPIPALRGGPFDLQLDGIPNTVPVEQSVVYQDGSGHTLKTVKKTWLDPFSIIGEQTILDNGQGMTSLRCYNSAEQVTDVYEYGFQSEGTYPGNPACVTSAGASGLSSSAIGPLRRHTVTAYHNFLGATPSTYIVNEPDSVTVYDGSGNQITQSSFVYDGSSLQPSGAQTGLVTPATLRGNPTSVTQWLNAGGTSPVTTYKYYDTGQIYQKTDPCGNTSCSDITGTNHTTTYSYADNYASGTGTPTGQTNAYLKQVTYPNTGVAHTESFSWGYSDGLPRSYTDQNNKSTMYVYNTPPAGCTSLDGLDRLSQINYPDGGQTLYCYNDALYSPSVTTSRLISSSGPNAGKYLTSVSTMNGLGLVKMSQLTSDSTVDCGSGIDTTATMYDGFGRVLSKSNPYCTTGDPTYGLTTYTYDALGRTIQVTNPDSTTVLTNYAGPATEVQDEGNGNGTWRVTRISQTDGLGRLTSMCEVAPGPFVVPAGASNSSLIGQNGNPATCGPLIAGTGFLTTYGYDVLDNLQRVVQGTIAARTFNYDSLSRLLCASNPENSTAACPTTASTTYTTGTTGYAYDPNGNLTTRTAPAPNQASGTVVTTYTYDALNRLLSKSYNDGKTPTASFAYDSVSNLPNLTNTIGRLVKSSGGPGIAAYTEYDPMGRVSESLQYTPLSGNNALPVPYTYDLLGDMMTMGNYFQTYTFNYNTAARLTGVTSTFTPSVLFSGGHYNAAGQITSDTLGTNEVETYTYTKRNQLQAETAKLSATQTYAYSLTFAPNGNVTASNDSVNNNWSYSYDQFNRLVCSNLLTNGTCASPTSGTPTYDYVYDRFGNRWQQNGPNTMLLTFTGNNTSNNNRMDGYSYDAAGNLLNDGTHTYTYDAENRIVQVATGGTTIATYAYDADGQRVHRTGVTTDTCDSTGTADYAYDLAGHWILEINNAGTQCKSEIYAGGRHYVTDVAGQTYFDHSDWLGTVRARNSYAGPSSFQTCTSLPFGDALTCTPPDGINNSTIHFTGKERDPESGLDNFGARYNASSIGRFMSPDWSDEPDPIPYADQSDPQSLNLYAYVGNSPVNATDDDGHDYDADPDPQTPKPAAKCNLPCQFKHWINDPPPKGATPPDDYDPVGKSLANILIGANNLGNQVAAAIACTTDGNCSSPQQFSYVKPSSPDEARAMSNINLALLFVPGLDFDALATDLARGVKPVAGSKELQSIIDELYQTTDKYPGGTAGAVRAERSGISVGGKIHSTKAAERARQLSKLIAKGRFSGSDLALAKAIVKDLSDALIGK